MPPRIFTDFYVVRHGESEGNREGLLQGRADPHLSANGRLQAEAAGRRLAETDFCAAYSSPLLRARETAELIVQFHPGLELVGTPELMELNVGILEGRRQLDVIQEMPDLFNALRFSHGNAAVPGGESLDDIQKRISAFLDAAVERHAGGKVLVVTHGWASHRLLAHAYGNPRTGVAYPVPNNASVSILRYFNDEKTWQLRSWNETGHLAALPVHNNPVD